MNSGELEGKYTVALERISGKAGAEHGDRHKPIYGRNSQMAEQQALEDAAKALTALWKLRKPETTRKKA